MTTRHATPKKFGTVHPEGNRLTRRTRIAQARQMPGLIKKQNIRNAHDKTLQRAKAKELLAKKS